MSTPRKHARFGLKGIGEWAICGARGKVVVYAKDETELTCKRCAQKIERHRKARAERAAAVAEMEKEVMAEIAACDELVRRIDATIAEPA